MAGKSTFLRQNALIAVLAQAGSFVPAEAATIGIVDRLFSRVGAADDLARGRSTFMVEMVETAAILNQATARSLVILDEIGRGTATFDGLSIAWATLEHLHEVNKCRALFATHFHELGALTERLAALAPLHDARQGMAGRGRVPARGGAGRRRPLLRHPRGAARGPAGRRGDARRGGAGGAGEGRAVGRGEPARRRPAAVRGGAGASGERRGQAVESEVETALASINPDELSPKQALDLLYELRAGEALGLASVSGGCRRVAPEATPSTRPTTSGTSRSGSSRRRAGRSTASMAHLVRRAFRGRAAPRRTVRIGSASDRPAGRCATPRQLISRPPRAGSAEGAAQHQVHAEPITPGSVPRHTADIGADRLEPERRR